MISGDRNPDSAFWYNVRPLAQGASKSNAMKKSQLNPAAQLYWTVNKAASVTGLSATAIRRLIRKGLVPSYKPHEAATLVNRDELLGYLAGTRVNKEMES